MSKQTTTTETTTVRISEIMGEFRALRWSSQHQKSVYVRLPQDRAERRALKEAGFVYAAKVRGWLI